MKDGLKSLFLTYCWQLSLPGKKATPSCMQNKGLNIPQATGSFFFFFPPIRGLLNWKQDLSEVILSVKASPKTFFCCLFDKSLRVKDGEFEFCCYVFF